MAELFADLPEALQNSVEIARRCNLTVELGKSRLPDFPTPAGEPLEAFLASESHAGLGATAGAALPGCRGARKAASGLCRAPRFRDRDHRQDGLPRLFPDRRRLHQLGQAQRRAGRSRARLRRRLAGGLQPRHHRPRPAALRPAVRALPQSGAGVDAGLRHRLLPGRPRPRHRLRQEEIRRARRVADRHLRHHGGQGGDPRCRPRARPRLQLRRPVRQADSQRTGHHAEGCAGEGTPDPAAHRRRGGSRRTVDAGAEARRPRAQRRHACRRRADRAGQAHRFLPAVFAGRREFGGLAIRQGRRREGRAGQVRLPRPAHPDHPRRGGAPGEGGRRRRHRPRHAAARRPRNLRQGVQDRQHHGGVPVRIRRHEGHAGAGPARPPRRPDRAQRAVPAGTDGLHPELHRPQARPRNAWSIRTPAWRRCWPIPTASWSTRSR